MSKVQGRGKFLEKVASFVFVREKGGLCNVLIRHLLGPIIFRLIDTKGE
jgi:hypothetical protein